MHEPSLQGSKFDQNSSGQMWSNVVKCGQIRLLIFICYKSRSNCRFSPNHIFQFTQNQSTYTFFDFISLVDPSSIHFSVSAQEPLLDRHKNIYTIYSLCFRTQIEPYHFQCYVKELYLLTFRGF